MDESNTLPARRVSIAALLSFLGTGVGHLYAGRLRRGLTLFALTLLFVPLCFLVASRPPSQLGLWLLLGTAGLAVVVYVAAIVDAMVCARRAARPYVPQPCNQMGLYALLTVVAVGWSVGGAFLVRANAFEAFKIATASMAPTLGANDRVLVDKFAYLYDAPQAGQIVVFRAPVDGSRNWIKRIVGLPGDTIEFKGGRVYRNGEPLPNPHAPKTDDRTIVIPNGSVYLLGDQRTRSRDSRHFGPVPTGTIIGTADYVLPGGPTPARVLQ